MSYRNPSSLTRLKIVRRTWTIENERRPLNVGFLIRLKPYVTTRTKMLSLNLENPRTLFFLLSLANFLQGESHAYSRW